MTSRDPLASPTLAQLYVEQGHLRRARKVLDAVLAEQPLQGQALVMRDRLRLAGEGSLVCELQGREIRLRWQKAPTDPGLHLVMMTAWRDGEVVRKRIESVRHEQRAGEHSLLAREGPASFVACIGAVDPALGFVAMTVADPITW
jgi:hypothetical protein